MTLSEIATIVMAALMAINLVWTIYWSRRVAEQVSEAKRSEDWQALGNRVAAVEKKIEALPARVASHDDIEKLHERISGVREIATRVENGLTGVGQALRAVERNVQLILHHHIPPGGSQ